MKKDMKRNCGFSLIELLIAMAIMSIVMVMVTQFMGTTSAALKKTRKNLAIQTEALEVGTQFSDALVQAKYVRVKTQDGKLYTLDTKLDGQRRKRQATDTGTTLPGDLVVDNYPNYISGSTLYRKIIVNKGDYSLISSLGSKYPLTSDLDSTKVSSFRLLTKNGDAANPLYVKPEYIYMQYEKKEGTSVTSSYVIFYLTGQKVYMNRGTLTAVAPNGDGFAAAQAAVNASAASGTGLLTEHADTSYFSADPDSEVVFMDVRFVNPKYPQYDYHYEETITLRNSNVLTVEPQKLFFKE